MRKLILLLGIFVGLSAVSFAQNKKAEKEAAAKAQFDKAVAAIDAKDFVIVVDTYEDPKDNTLQTNTDMGIFASYEKDFAFLQGTFLTGDNSTHRMNVSDYKQTVDKKENVRIEMQLKGSLLTAKVEIYLKKGGNYADVIITPVKGTTKRFSGELVPRAESKYIKRPGVV